MTQIIIIGVEWSFQAVDSRLYAIDWKQIKGDAAFSGDARDVRSYYSYGKVVLAVGDSRIVTARDGLPDNIPGHGESFHLAVGSICDLCKCARIAAAIPFGPCDS
jgi:hypothetical protein